MPLVYAQRAPSLRAGIVVQVTALQRDACRRLGLPFGQSRVTVDDVCDAGLATGMGMSGGQTTVGALGAELTRSTWST